MKKNIKSKRKRRGTYKAAVFPMMSTAVLSVKSIISNLSFFQEKLIYVTLGLLFLCILVHMIRSRVSYEPVNNKRGG